MKRYLVILLILLFSMSGIANAARHDKLPLRVGSAGPNVTKLQYLIRDPRPKQNVFKHVKGTYKGKATGYFGKRTGAAVFAYKYRLGYPPRYNRKGHPVAGKYFFDLLQGRKHPTLEMVGLAARRLKLVSPNATPKALAIKALLVEQLGTSESPRHSNRGPRISYTSRGYGPYQGATGAYGAAWCVSLDQWAFMHKGGGTFANRSAGVIYVEQWAKVHGYLRAKAKVGALVAFLDDGGHMGYVTKILGSGYVTIEGNSSDSVRQVYHPWNDRLRVFIYIPGVA